MNSVRVAAVAAAISTSLFFAAAANAASVDVNISAVTNGVGSMNPVNQVLAAGNYTLSAIGTGQGGLYNAWSPGGSACIEVCLPTWNWSFTVLNSEDPGFLHFIGVPGPFSTATAALSAAQAAPIWQNGEFQLPVGPFTPGTIGNPINFTMGGVGTLSFNIFDADGNYANNAGGVSLRITSAAVPEPATWGMLILGFGGMGLMLRRRRMALATA